MGQLSTWVSRTEIKLPPVTSNQAQSIYLFHLEILQLYSIQLCLYQVNYYIFSFILAVVPVFGVDYFFQSILIGHKRFICWVWTSYYYIL